MALSLFLWLHRIAWRCGDADVPLCEGLENPSKVLPPWRDRGGEIHPDGLDIQGSDATPSPCGGEGHSAQYFGTVCWFAELFQRASGAAPVVMQALAIGTPR